MTRDGVHCSRRVCHSPRPSHVPLRTRMNSEHNAHAVTPSRFTETRWMNDAKKMSAGVTCISWGQQIDTEYV